MKVTIEPVAPVEGLEIRINGKVCGKVTNLDSGRKHVSFTLGDIGWHAIHLQGFGVTVEAAIEDAVREALSFHSEALIRIKAFQEQRT